MVVNKAYFQECLANIMYKFNLAGSIIHQVYATAINHGNFTNCKINYKPKDFDKLKKELDSLIEDYILDNPSAKISF